MTRPTLSKRVHPRIPVGSTTSSYYLAELSYQRGDYSKALRMVRGRLRDGDRDPQTLNLEAACIAQMERLEEAENLFLALTRAARSGPYREKSRFNLGLIRLYRDLAVTGDCSVSKTAFAPPSVSPRLHLSKELPFKQAIETWETLLDRRGLYENITHTYLSFAYLQFGDLDRGLAHIVCAMRLSESFYVSNYVLGRMFLDLYMLGAENNHFFMAQDVATFFEFEDEEILDKQGGRVVIYHDIYLDFALQAFLDARSGQLSVEVLLGLFHTYLLGGMYEEALQILQQAESFAPEALPVIDAQFRLNEVTQRGLEHIRPLVARLNRLKQQRHGYLGQYLIPRNYLL